MIVGQLAAGQSVDALLADYPYLEREDITQALWYAAWRSEEREVVFDGTTLAHGHHCLERIGPGESHRVPRLQVEEQAAGTSSSAERSDCR
jgi:hypothetical protein